MRLLVLVLLVVVAGCASEPVQLESPPARVTVPISSTPEPPSKEVAAKRYLEVVRPYNEALEQLEQSINTGAPVATMRAKADAVVAANEKQLLDLNAVVWPMDVREAMGELAAESVKAQEFFKQAARAQTRDQVVQAVLAAMKHNGKVPAGVVRERLELAKYAEGDYGGK